MLGDYYLIGNPSFGIAGAPISTAICYWMIALLNLFQIQKLSHLLPSFGKTVWRPLTATIGMGAAAYCFYTILTRLLGAAPASAIEKIITLATIPTAAAVYLLLLLLLHAIDREDVLLLPKGEKIAKLLHLE